MKQTLLTILRNLKTPSDAFRQAADKLAAIMAVEASQELSQESFTVKTLYGDAEGVTLKDPLVLVPILRAGLVLLPPFLHLFERARVGFFGIRREEQTATPILYYEKLPSLTAHDVIFLLDPMIATGGSSLLSVNKLIEKGARPSNIFIFSFIASKEGVFHLSKRYPEVKLNIVAIDETLNAQKFIVPGLGDFGDRYFGT
jgi:uracil phosphoribosyltransferase